MTKLPIRQERGEPLIVQVDLPDLLYRVFAGADRPLTFRPPTPKQMDRAQEALTTIQVHRGLLNLRNIVPIIASVITTRSALDEIGFRHAQLHLDETDKIRPVLVVTLPKT